MSAIATAYPDDIKAMLDGLSSFVQRVVIPAHQKHDLVLDNPRRRFDSDGRTSAEAWKIVSEVRQKAAEAGFYTMCVPEDLGGAGMGYLAYFAAWERIFHLCANKYWLGAVILSHWARGPSALLSRLSPELRAAIVPDLMAGKTTLCFGLSEPSAGSDATMLKTRATQDGDGWRLNGRKIWITNAPYANHAIIFAITSPELAEARNGGISAFLVPTSAPGFQVESLITMWGSSGTDEAQLRFDDVRIEPEQLIGELHQGFAIAMIGVGLGRLYNAARGVGIGRWALELGVDYAKVRRTFDKPISEHQGVSFPLSESAMELHAAHLVSMNAAKLLDQGQLAKKELSIAKALAVQAGRSTVDRVIQVHGAMGVTNEMHLTSAYTALRNADIADGSAEILRRQVAKCLFGGDVDV
jgi:acyl-CoA dehydrogenase